MWATEAHPASERPDFSSWQGVSDLRQFSIYRRTHVSKGKLFVRSTFATPQFDYPLEYLPALESPRPLPYYASSRSASLTDIFAPHPTIGQGMSHVPAVQNVESLAFEKNQYTVDDGLISHASALPFPPLTISYDEYTHPDFNRRSMSESSDPLFEESSQVPIVRMRPIVAILR